MKNKYHVLEICESYGGGVKRQVDYLNEYISADSFALTTLVSSKRGSNVPVNYFLEDRMSLFPQNIYLFIKSIRTVHILIKKEKIDLIHAHSTIAGIVAILHKIIYSSKIPIIYTPHAYYSEISRGNLKDFVLIHIEKFMSYFFSMNIHVSEEEENYALKSGIVSRFESTVVNNGIPSKNNELIIDHHSELRFVNVARCDYQKNPELFIKIARIISNNISNVDFTWVGDGPLIDKCREHVKDMNLETIIHFVGYSGNPFKYLTSSDIFLSTSRYEGQPFSVIEALSAGLPLILTDIVGHEELVKENGKLIDDKKIANEHELITLFKNVIEHSKTESQISRKLYEEKYNVGNMIEGIEYVYKELL